LRELYDKECKAAVVAQAQERLGEPVFDRLIRQFLAEHQQDLSHRLACLPQTSHEAYRDIIAHPAASRRIYEVICSRCHSYAHAPMRENAASWMRRTGG
jgi:cytochrome c5